MRPPERSSVFSLIATSQKPRWSPGRSTSYGLLSSVDLETQRAKRHRRIRALSTTGQVAGAASEQVGLAAHPRKGRPAHLRFSQCPLFRCRRRYLRGRTPKADIGSIFIPGARRSRRLLSSERDSPGRPSPGFDLCKRRSGAVLGRDRLVQRPSPSSLIGPRTGGILGGGVGRDLDRMETHEPG